MSNLESISLDSLAKVSGGAGATYSPTQVNSALHFATKKLGGGPVFEGDVTNSTHAKTFTRAGILVSTGDEANTQFYVGRVLMKHGAPTGLKDM